ncbi:MAG: metallopeptidase family protein [Chloroflexota bacterium]|nr:metallopeptidase family protein [Chloroflexota bacterium]
MQRERFEELVDKALEALPDQFARELDGVVIVVEDWPSPTQLYDAKVNRKQDLLGLYEGVPLTKRGRRPPMRPDKISIFQKPIEMRCRYDSDVADMVFEVVHHEVAHFFGISDERLRQIEKGR